MNSCIMFIDYFAQKGVQIAEKLSNLQVVQDAANISVFISRFPEVNTEPILDLLYDKSQTDYSILMALS